MTQMLCRFHRQSLPQARPDFLNQSGGDGTCATATADRHKSDGLRTRHTATEKALGSPHYQNGSCLAELDPIRPGTIEYHQITLSELDFPAILTIYAAAGQLQM